LSSSGLHQPPGFQAVPEALWFCCSWLPSPRPKWCRPRRRGD
jgi:hypothetical protein